jgi:hypothetical protein
MQIRLKELKKLTLRIVSEPNLRNEYEIKTGIVTDILEFNYKVLDEYFKKILSKKYYFKIFNPVKIYNDKRIFKYIHKSN